MADYGYIRDIPNSPNSPQTSESENCTAHTADCLQCLQMTDPDDHHQGQGSQNVFPPLLPVVQQPVFTHHIPQVHIPANLDAPRLFPWPINGLQVPVKQPGQAAPLPAPANDPFAIAPGQNNNLGPQLNNNVVPAFPLGNNNLVLDIPPVQLPVGWDAPLQNPVPRNVSLAPIPAAVRQGRPRGPVYNIAGGQADPALHSVHHGHVAHREQVANRNAYLLNQLQQQQRQQEEERINQLLQKEQEQHRRNAENAARQEAEHQKNIQQALRQEQLRYHLAQNEELRALEI